ncbi:MAG: hypothetical protein J6T81_07895 [Bacteroidales bacterium]|nr:hypothetical protein [Bacteroidales bacterium]
MKKAIVTLSIVLALGLCANAQFNHNRSDGFFNTWDDVSNGLDKPSDVLPVIPGGHGGGDDVNVPVGSGLLILTALGAVYAFILSLSNPYTTPPHKGQSC